MPWEQIENTTIRIEAPAPSTAPFAQAEDTLLGGDSDPVPSAPTQYESVAEHVYESRSCASDVGGK